MNKKLRLAQLSPKNTPYRSLILFLALLLATFSSRAGLSTNVMSRTALMISLTENSSFEITPWKNLTMDWAQTPDGKYYSNKAPGPSLLAAPLFALFYLPIRAAMTPSPVSDFPKSNPWRNSMAFILWIVCLLTQILPLIWVVSRLVVFLEKNQAPKEAILFFILATMFGSIGSFFMNSFFGHGIAVITALASFLFLLEKKWKLSGLAIGLGVLSDYGSLFLVPAAGLYLLFAEKKRVRALWSLLLGGVGPLLVFMLYHAQCFGGPFTLPQKFQNPIFVDTQLENAKFGVFSLFPNLKVILALLFSPQRGLLFSQPYTLLLIPSLDFQTRLFFSKKELTPQERGLAWSALLFFLLLLWMNAGFNGWHGGSTPGPRYLSAGIPVLALAGAYLWNRFPSWILWGLKVTTLISVLFFTLALAIGQCPNENQALWPYFFEQLTQETAHWAFDFRLLAMGLLFLVFQKVNSAKSA
jgi:hypothetical protein